MILSVLLAIIVSVPLSATTFAVTTTNDSGAGSLRQAIIDANADTTATEAAPHIIKFKEGLTGTISLQLPLAPLNNHISIIGPGASAMTVTRGGDSLFGLFVIGQKKTATISGLTIAKGSGLKPPIGGTIGGGAIANVGTLTISNCVFAGNTHQERGGAISNYGTLTLSNCEFSDNTAPAGGAIYNYRLITMNHCTLSHNGDSTTKGGCIANTSELVMKGCRFIDNNALDEGSSIYNPGTLTADSCIFARDTASYAASIASYGTFTATYCSFTDNESTGNAGAIGGSKSMSFSNCTFSNNRATGNAGAIESYDKLTLLDCSFSNNSAGGNGGAIENFGPASIGRCVFADNDAVNGGAISNRDFGGMTLTDVSIAGNAAVQDGGGIYSSGTLTLSNSELSNNTADNGGSIHIVTRTVSINNSTIFGNASSSDGGAIYNKGALTLTNATIAGNSATGGGGGIFSPASSTISPLNTIIASNSASVAPDLLGFILSKGHNLIGNADSSNGWITSDQTGSAATPIDPKLGTFQYQGGITRTMQLLTGSTAINNGSDEVLDDPYNFTTDQRGTVRKIGVYVDIGACESPFIEAGLPVGASGDLLSTGTIGMRLYPNPAHKTFQIDYTLAAPAEVTLELYTIAGRQVYVALEDAPRETGTHTEHIDVSTLSPGLYTLQLVTPTGRSVYQVVVVK